MPLQSQESFSLISVLDPLCLKATGNSRVLMEATSDQTMLALQVYCKICYVVPNTAAGRMPSGL